jgi:purine-binding chemotaxis protein CheW
VETDVSSTSNQILDIAAKRRQEKQVVDVEVERTLLVVFHLDRVSSVEEAGSMMGEGPYGLPASDVESIVTVDEITYVPGTPPWILGVVNVRGEIESVLDLKAVLGLGQAERTPGSRLLICQEGELRSGLLVDRMVDIVDVPSTAIGPAPTPLEGGKGIYVAGETEYGGQTMVVLNLSEIFRRALETDRV